MVVAVVALALLLMPVCELAYGDVSRAIVVLKAAPFAIGALAGGFEVLSQRQENGIAMLSYASMSGGAFSLLWSVPWAVGFLSWAGCYVSPKGGCGAHPLQRDIAFAVSLSVACVVLAVFPVKKKATWR